MMYSFSCDEVALECNARKRSDDHVLTPWCCAKNVEQMLRVLDELAERHGFHYEIGAGTALGAVKMNNFIPWDIDADTHVNKEIFMKHFGNKNGAGYKAFKESGIRVSLQINNPSLDARLNGKDPVLELGPWSKILTYDPNHITNLTYGVKMVPTKIKFGNTWVRTQANPAAVIRARYGPNYLKHAQSFRAYGYNSDLGDNFSWSDQAKNGWSRCKVVSDGKKALHHSCLELYENDGNMNLIPKYYPGSRISSGEKINNE